MRKKRGFVLLAAIFLVLFLGIFLSISLVRSNLQLRMMHSRRASLYAFYAAEAGIDQALYELRRDINWSAGFNDVPLVWQRQGEAPETIGFYSVQVGPQILVGSLPGRWIRSIGQDAPFATGDPRLIDPGRVIFARIVLLSPLDFFASTPGDLRLGSNTTINGNIMGKNLVFDVTPTAPVGEREITVNGYARYDRVSGGHPGYPDPDGYVVVSGGVIEGDPITYVGIDHVTYLDMAQNQNNRYIPSGSAVLQPADATHPRPYLRIEGNIDRTNLATANGLLYVDADVDVSGDVTESVHIVSTGNIYISGNIHCIQSPTTGIEPQIGLSASTNVYVSSSAPSSGFEIQAYIMADGMITDIDGSGNITSTADPAGGKFWTQGGANSKDTIEVDGVIVVRGVTDPNSSSIALNTYRDRTYSYNPALRTNLTIPYLTSPYSRVDNWREVSPTEPFPPT